MAFRWSTAGSVRAMRIVLLVLALPVGLAAYLVSGQLLIAAGLGSVLGGLVVAFVPLFVAGVVAIPFVAPFIDQKAKQALADAPSRRGESPGRDDTPGA